MRNIQCYRLTPLRILLTMKIERKSFKAFFNELLVVRGFELKGKSHWYRRIGDALIVISLHNVRYDPGVYLEYGLAFSDITPERHPTTNNCPVSGWNPGLSKTDYIHFQDLLKDVKAICRQPSLQQEIAAALDKQVKQLVEWTDREKLVKRVRSRKPLTMFVNHPALGLPL